jgi:glycosyltransferase involved in cell wall biosynthesis
MIQKLSIIIPAYNEGKTIHVILNKLKEVDKNTNESFR